MWQVSTAPSGPHAVPARSATYRARAQNLDFVPRNKIKIQRVGKPVLPKRTDHQLQHIELAFRVLGFQGHDVAGRIVQDAVNAQRLVLLADQERRTVTHVSVPQCPGVFRLPTQASFRAAAVARGDAVQPVVHVQPPHRRS
jgi:hypothetical protein